MFKIYKMKIKQKLYNVKNSEISNFQDDYKAYCLRVDKLCTYLVNIDYVYSALSECVFNAECSTTVKGKHDKKLQGVYLDTLNNLLHLQSNIQMLINELIAVRLLTEIIKKFQRANSLRFDIVRYKVISFFVRRKLNKLYKIITNTIVTYSIERSYANIIHVHLKEKMKQDIIKQFCSHGGVCNKEDITDEALKSAIYNRGVK